MIRWLRGRVVLREEQRAESGVIWTPEREAREVTQHYGRVVALGPPALTRRRYVDGRWIGGVEIPHECKVGDLVLFVFEAALERLRTIDLGEGPLVVVHQEELVGVIDAA